VPLPSAIDDHQTANAASLADAGAARLIKQPDFTPPALTALLADMLNNAENLARAATAAAATARPHAAAALADLLERHAHLTEARA
jgi:UDP-N-acetylglucosamine--N-acetylmuramyl-(pentapeptide) pyrophosphoryl-undecaprenol N-acetylglucosamine transferase